MPPPVRRVNGLSSPSSPAKYGGRRRSGGDRFEREVAEADVLKLWRIPSLNDILPHEITPSYWSKPLVRSLYEVAKQTPLVQAKLLLADQVYRRRHGLTNSKRPLSLREVLTVSDIDAILRLNGNRIVEEPEPASELSVR